MSGLTTSRSAAAPGSRPPTSFQPRASAFPRVICHQPSAAVGTVACGSSIARNLAASIIACATRGMERSVPAPMSLARLVRMPSC